MGNEKDLKEIRRSLRGDRYTCYQPGRPRSAESYSFDSVKMEEAKKLRQKGRVKGTRRSGH